MRGLKISLEDLEPVAEEEVYADGLRLGSLLVSSNGVSSAGGGASYVLSPDDLVVLTTAEGGFLGKGSSGAVRRATVTRTGVVLAVKEIKITSQAHLSEIRRELETLYESGDYSSSRFLVDFHGAYSHEGSVFIAMECLDGSLNEVQKPVPPRVISNIIRGVLQGLVYLHRTRHLIHRDLKPSNVLFNRTTGDIKISDFGVSSTLDGTKGDAHSFVGTVTYMSPERLRGEVYSYAADIWSLGLLAAELALGKCPFASLRGESTEARFWSLLQHLSHDGPALVLPEELDLKLVDFIAACVAKNPDQRPTCTELLQHPFMIMNINMDVPPRVRDQADREAVKEWLAATSSTSRERKGSAGTNDLQSFAGTADPTRSVSGMVSCPSTSASLWEDAARAADGAGGGRSPSRGDLNLDEELSKLLQ